VRTVYIGTSGFALAVLEASGLSPELVVTRPPSARGRGRRVEPSPVAQGARAAGYAVLEPERLDDVAGELAALAPDVVCLCAYGAMVREPLLSAYEILGVHPSLVPRWRGAAPIERAIMAGDRRTGVSIIRLVAELDAGPVCASGELEIGEREDYGGLATRLARLGGELLARAAAGPRDYAPQPQAGITYAEKIAAADRVLDPRRPAAELDRTVRALHPHIGARTADGLGVLEAQVHSGDGQPAPGRLALHDGRLLLGASRGHAV
jgi:methionyl-tRNA formyltransferase